MAPLRARLTSGNADKLEELRAALPGWELELLETPEPFPDEVGESYYENARSKAEFGRRVGPQSGEAAVWIFGEDSGIEVAALGGRPGIASARWAEDGVAALLEELRGVSDRRARYVCELVALSPDGEERTVAELGDAWKRGHSHRARAAAATERQVTGFHRRDLPRHGRPN